MNIYIKRKLKYIIEDSDYEEILHLYNGFLSEEGYEIMKDINHFNIIDYNSDEYQDYCSSYNKSMQDKQVSC